MTDQAETLRSLMHEHRSAIEQVPAAVGQAHRPRRVVAVASGKGGVGKSNFCINFGLALQQVGTQPVVLDADMGFADVELLLGVQPRNTIFDVLSGKDVFDVIEVSSGGLHFLSSGNGLNVAPLTQEDVGRLSAHMDRLFERYDVVLIDAGAGDGGQLGYLLAEVDDLLLVTTPEPTAIADAYALVKMLSVRGQLPPVKIVVNKVPNFGEGRQAADKLKLAAQRFLGVELSVLGYVVEDAAVARAVMRQQALVQAFPTSPAARCMRQIVQNYTRSAQPPSRQGGTRVWERWLQRLRRR